MTPRQRRFACACAGVIATHQLTNGWYNAPLYEASKAGYWFLNAFMFLVVPTAALAALKRSTTGFRDFSIDLPRQPVDWFDILVLSAFLTVLLWLTYRTATVLAYAALQSPRPTFYFAMTIPNAPILRPLVASYSALTTGWVEEWTYKGALYYLSTRYLPVSSRNAAFVMVSAVLFAVIHWENGIAEVTGAFFLALLGALLFLKIRNVLPFAIAHAGIDLWHFL